MMFIVLDSGWLAPPKAQIAMMFACGATPTSCPCQAISIFGLHRDGEPSGLDTADHLAHGLPIGDAEGVNSAAQHAYGFLRHNGKAETLYDAADLLRRRAGSELGHQFVRRKPRFA